MHSGREVKNVLFIFLVLFKKFYSGQDDESYCQNKISRLQSEQLCMLTVAKKQMTVVRSSLQTVGYRSADVAAKWKSVIGKDVGEVVVN